MSTKITFLRHGETDANSQGRYSGSLDLPLNEIGEAHVKQAAVHLSKEKFDVLQYGCMKRVSQTANIVLEQLTQKPPLIEQTDTIRELDFGLFEGLKYAEIEEKYPAEWAEYMERWAGFTFPEGDSIQSFFGMCNDYILALSQRFGNKNILIVAHKGFILCSYCALCGEGAKQIFTRDVRNAKTLIWQG